MISVKELAARLLCASGLPMLARWRNSRRLVILMFHGVESEPLSPPCDWVVDTATLRRNLGYVRRHYHVLPLEEALERLRDGSLPRRSVAVTFDDGTRNLLTNAAPVLRDLGVPAAVFLATGPMGTAELLWPDRLWQAFAQTTRHEIDLTAMGLGIRSLRTDADRVETRDSMIELLKQMPDSERITGVQALVSALGEQIDVDSGPFQLLSWDEAGALARDGLVTLHPHSVTHPILARCDAGKVDYEVSESCRAVEINTGHAPTIFAYPNGGVQDFDERTRVALSRNGIRWALSTIDGLAGPESDPLALPRMGVSPDQSLALFKRRISGLVLRPRRRRVSDGDRSEGRDVGCDVCV